MACSLLIDPMNINDGIIYHFVLINLPFTKFIIYLLQINFNINTYIDYFYQNKTKF